MESTLEYTFYFDAVSKADVAGATKVYNGNDITYWVPVRIPPYIMQNYSPYCLKACTSDLKRESQDIIKHCKWNNKPWINVEATFLDLRPGHHLYRIGFINKYTDDIVSLYFGYIVQCNHPEKPYVYMDPENNTCNCDKHE